MWPVRRSGRLKNAMRACQSRRRKRQFKTGPKTKQKNSFFIHFEPPYWPKESVTYLCYINLPIGVCISVFKFGGENKKYSPEKPKDKKSTFLDEDDVLKLLLLLRKIIKEKNRRKKKLDNNKITKTFFNCWLCTLDLCTPITLLELLYKNII